MKGDNIILVKAIYFRVLKVSKRMKPFGITKV
jgi:hypothetical protein